jgi:hypothetical protein
MRSLFSNIWHVSIKGSKGSTVVRGQTKLIMTESPTNQDWYERFMLGMHKRLGDKSCPDRAISIELMLELHKVLKIELTEALRIGNTNAIDEIITAGAFSTIGYCGGLRGEEIILTSLDGMNKNMEAGLKHSTPHVPLALRGRFKGETGEQWHFLPLALKTNSGIFVHYWISKLLALRRQQGRTSGPAFLGPKGEKVKAGHFSQSFLSRFLEIQKQRPDIIPDNVDVLEEYGMSRSWRKGSDSQALNQGLQESDINRNNRWRTKESAGTRMAKLSMINHYADARLMTKRLMQYSLCL